MDGAAERISKHVAAKRTCAVIPISFRRKVLFVRLRLDQTGIRREALPTDQAVLNASRDSLLGQTTQQFALT